MLCGGVSSATQDGGEVCSQRRGAERWLDTGFTSYEQTLDPPASNPAPLGVYASGERITSETRHAAGLERNEQRGRNDLAESAPSAHAEEDGKTMRPYWVLGGLAAAVPPHSARVTLPPRGSGSAGSRRRPSPMDNRSRSRASPEGCVPRGMG